MANRVYICLMILLGLSQLEPVLAQGGRFHLEHADRLEVVPQGGLQTWYAVGEVVFQTETGFIYCDSAVWRRGRDVELRGNVRIDDEDLQLIADSVHYDLDAKTALAQGSYVELWAKPDSIFAVGTHAYLDQETEYMHMTNRPTLYLQYPDTANMIEVIADDIYHEPNIDRAEAIGNVKISSEEMSSSSGCAVMHLDVDILDLFENPVARRDRSVLEGSLISIQSVAGQIARIDVVDSAEAEFIEPVDSAETMFDRSELRAERMIFDFRAGELRQITSFGQAYSWYFPNDQYKSESQENEVSGDTIKFFIDEKELYRVSVIGGAIGTYLNRKMTVTDSLVDTITDTIDYQAREIDYYLKDSLIRLTYEGHLTSGQVELDAHRVDIATDERIVYAYSADVVADSTDLLPTLTDELQPNPLPVILKDGAEELFGDYLEYSMDTEKGRIYQSKSAYQSGFFYGSKLYREKRDIYYLNEGRYTTCDADEPHFHFKSDNLKLIEGQKLIAKPVVFNLGRLPLLAIPYYVFPLEKGRHSGWLTFDFGVVNPDNRYIRNVGYYWAASEYWDIQAAVDFYENRNHFNVYSRFNYNKRYAYQGYLSGNYGREIGYNSSVAREVPSNRWTFSGSHRHTVSPSFQYSATADFQSDSRYQTDFSSDLEKRLDRVLRSDVNFSKRFGRSVSLSGSASRDDFLDEGKLITRAPSLNLTLPSWRPFGSGQRNEQGQLERRWYNEFVVTYRPSALNFAQRDTDTLIQFVDTVFDSTAVYNADSTAIDSFLVDTAVVNDTTEFRTRREYARINHSASLNAPFTVARYFVFRPTFSYNEVWYRILQTDQSDSAGIDADNYRAYSYSVGASLRTDLYGTVYPNLFGLIGLRQVLTPDVGYSFTPDIDRHPQVRAYAGGGPGSSRQSQRMNFGLTHYYQAKIAAGEQERNLNLVSINHRFSYDFERDSLNFSDMTTTINSTVLPKLNFSGTMVHSFYEPGTSDLQFFSPTLESFSFNANLTLSGSRFIFDDPSLPTNIEADTARPGQFVGSERARSGWSAVARYTYRQSGRDNTFTKDSFISFSLQFNLTPKTRVRYNHFYNFSRHRTVNQSVNIVRDLHCWTGEFTWVPTGSNRGWGFRLYVTDLPQLKIDQSDNPASAGFFEGLRP